MVDAQFLWLFTGLGSFICGALVGAFSRRLTVAGFTSAVLSISGFMTYLVAHEPARNRIELLVIVSPFLPIPFILMFGIGCAGAALGIRIAGGKT